MTDTTRKIRTKESMRRAAELANIKPLPSTSFQITHNVLCEAVSTYLTDHVFKYPVVVNHIRMISDNVLFEKSDTREFIIQFEPEEEE